MIGASLNVPCDCLFLKGLRDGSRWRAYYLVLKGHAFGIVFRKPGLRGVRIREDLEVIGVSNLLARIHVDQHGHFDSVASIFCLPFNGSLPSLSAHRSLFCSASFALRSTPW